MDDKDREHEISSVLVKGGAALVALCALIALGTFGMVKFLGLDGSGTGPAANVGAPASPKSLPTTALPVPGDSSSSSPEESFSPGPATGLHLVATPQFVRPMERINLTGEYPTHDAVQLQVQRRENGTWTDFPVQVVVRMGTFATYVMTGHTGDNRFRVYDPAEDKASNVVRVTIQ